MKFVQVNLSYGTWNKTSIVRTIIRIACSFIFYGIMSFPYFTQSSDLDETQIPFIFIAKFFAPSFLPAFLLFAFGRVVFYRMRLINERAIGGIFETLNEEQDDDEETDDEGNKVGSGGKNVSLEFMEIELASRV